MKIGIDASRAFLKNRTGIEEYSYQVIKKLGDKLKGHQVFLYVRKDQVVDFSLPKNWSASWRIKVIKWPRFWTQIGLSLELLFHPVDTLFIPAHTIPFVHPKNSIVTIHGLEYEFCPQAYSWWEKFYMRVSIKNSCRWAKTIIAVSENTKKDLMKLYGVAEDKIKVIYEGYDADAKSEIRNPKSEINSKFQIPKLKPYLLFIGRLEGRKNICGIISAFEVLKEKYKIPHKLVLAGKPGFGYEKINCDLQNANYKEDIILTGFVSKEEKRELLKNADVFIFTTFYEGFGIPILEAQSAGVPVVASNNSSIPEIISSEGSTFGIPKVEPSEAPLKENRSAILVDPNNVEEIFWAAYNLISDKALRDDIIKKGLENVKRFSWDKCASEIARMLIDAN